MKKKLRVDTAREIFEKILLHPDNDVILSRINDALDELANDDFFGTEGQTDPRGDIRG